MPAVGAFLSGVAKGFAAAFGYSGGAVSVGAGASAATAASWGVAVGGFLAGTLITVGLSSIAMKVLGPSLDDLGQQMSFGIRSTPGKKFVYGETRVGADIVFITTGKWYHGDYGSYVEKKSEDYNLHIVAEIAGHPCESIDEVWIKDEKITLVKVTEGEDDRKDLYPDQSSKDRNGVQRWIPSGTSYDTRMMLKLYTGEQLLADADLFDGCNLPSSNDVWTAEHIGKGKTYVYIKCHYDPDVFMGMPVFTFKVKGKNDIRDPRCDVDFTADHTTETFTATGHGMSNGDIVQLATTGTLPAGTAVSTNYYVVSKTDNTFKLSTTRGGSALSISDNGTGIHTVDHQGGYRSNTALCLADYMTTIREKGGVGEEWDQINEAKLITAANICDQDPVIHDDNTTQKRYFLGGSFKSSSDPAEILSEFLNSMAGWMERINGKWHINAGSYTAPAMTLTESELIARPSVQINRPYKDTYNSITPQLRSENTEWQPGISDSVEALTNIDVSPDHTTETFTASGHGRSDGDRVKFIAWTGTAVDNDGLPSGILKETFYYIVNKTTNTFQVSLTKSGPVAAFADNGTGTIVAQYDNYLSRDKARRKLDAVYSLINDETLARRLSMIALLQMRQEAHTELHCKIGTEYACPFDLVVGDSVRWIDAHKSFWEYTGGAVNAGTDSAGTITSVAHGLENGDPVVITDSDDTGWTEAFPFYVINKTTDTFQIAAYRGGNAITADSTYPIQYQTIQGKLFRVNGWRFSIDNGILSVVLSVGETESDIYTWTSGYQVAPQPRESITVRNTLEVATPTNLVAESGTDVLYVRTDGTIGTRVKLTWDEPDDIYILSGGYTEMEYRQTPDIQFTVDYLTDDEVFNSTEHGLVQYQEVQLKTSGALPTGLSTGKYYYVHSATANSFKLAEYRGAGDAVTFTDNGTGTHKVDPEENSWVSHPAVVGGCTEAYLTDVVDGQDYDFRVRFKNAMGNKGSYDTVAAHTVVGKTAAPAAPTGVAASTTNSTHIGVTWTDPADADLDHIEIHRDFGTGYSLYATVKAGTERFDDPQVLITTGPPQTSVRTYGYKLKAVDTTGNKSSFTSAVNGSISNNSEPTGLSTNVSSNIYVSFTVPTGEYQKVKAYKRTDSGDPFEWFDDVFRDDSPNNQTRAVSLPGSGDTIEFRLTTVDESGREGTAAEISYTVP